MEQSTILKSYVDFLLSAGERPRNVYSFCEKIGIEEAQF